LESLTGLSRFNMNGILIVDKPKGLTSHDVVNFVRKKFGIKKVGHAGSLDPIATGVLVLLLGEATKLSAKLMSDDKVYDAALELGVTTDTLDADGKIAATKDVSGVDNEKIKTVFSKFCGELLQEPPFFSAVKHNGTPLYKLARRGISVKKEPRRINIKELVIEKIDLPKIFFRVHCSKGTYIRKLCDDIGKELGCGAHMTFLRRVKSGDFGIEESISFEELKSITPEKLQGRLRQV